MHQLRDAAAGNYQEPAKQESTRVVKLTMTFMIPVKNTVSLDQLVSLFKKEVTLSAKAEKRLSSILAEDV
jgi:hypothetical protein